MWSEEHRPFSCTSASVYESELVHCQSYNHPLPFCIYIYTKKEQHFPTHEIWKQIDLYGEVVA